MLPVFLLSSLLFAAQTPLRTNSASLGSVVQAYTKTRGYQQVAVVTNLQVGGDHDGNAGMPLPPGAANATVALYYAAPDRFRVQGNTGTAGWLHVLQGKKSYFSNTGRTGGMWESSIPLSLIDYRLLEQGLSSWRALRQEEVALGDAHVACTVIEANYSRNGVHWGTDNDLNKELFRLNKRILWVDNVRHAVLREVDSIEGDWWTADAPRERRTLFERTSTVQELEWDDPPEESRFTFQPLSRPGPSDPNQKSSRYYDERTEQNPELEYLWLPIVDGCDNAGDLHSRIQCVQKAAVFTCASVPVSAEVERAQLSGCVSLNYSISPEGRVEDLRVGEIGLGLDEEVATCVAQWRFRPFQTVGHNPTRVTRLSPVGVRRFESPSFWTLNRVEFQPENGVSRPVFLKTSYPARPPNQQAIGSAEFHVHLVVGVDGKPRDVRVEPPVDPKLDAVAVRTVVGWRFRPGESDGQAVEVPAVFYLTVGNGNCSARPR